MNKVIRFNQILVLLWNDYCVFNDLEPFSSSWRGHYAFVRLWFFFPLSARNLPKRGNRAHWSYFLRIILSTAFLSFFGYYLYLGQYSFMLIMYYSRTVFFYVYYVLFLSVHLEIGGVIFFILQRENVKLQKKHLELSPVTSKNTWAEASEDHWFIVRKDFGLDSWHFQSSKGHSVGNPSIRLVTWNVLLLCLEDSFTNLCYS